MSRLLQAIRAAGSIGLVILGAGCAGSGNHTGEPTGGAPYWPFHGFTRYDGLLLGNYRDRFFAPGDLAIDPRGTTLFVPSARSGSMTLVRLPEGSIDAVLDFGEGSRFEKMIFRPDGAILYALASTVEADNLGRLPLARALLEVEVGVDMGRQPIPLRPGGWSRGVALRPDVGLLYSLDTAGPDLPGGATLTRIDLYNGDVRQQRRLGGVPYRVRGDGLLYDDRERWLMALLSNDEPGSDFDPPSEPTRARGTFVAWIDPDTLGVRWEIGLEDRLEYLGIAPSPRGVVAIGVAHDDHSRGTAIVELDPHLGRDVAWLDLPEPVSDVAASGDRLLLPARRGLYLVALDFLTIQGFIPVPFERPGDIAVSADGATACVTFDDPEFPGRTALAVLDVDAGRLVKVIR